MYISKSESSRWLHVMFSKSHWVYLAYI